jgi:hypothetical protein
MTAISISVNGKRLKASPLYFWPMAGACPVQWTLSKSKSCCKKCTSNNGLAWA